MATFLVTYRDSSEGTWHSSFEADQVDLTDDKEWFHFVADGQVVARVQAHDVRLVELKRD